MGKGFPTAEVVQLSGSPFYAEVIFGRGSSFFNIDFMFLKERSSRSGLEREGSSFGASETR